MRQPFFMPKTILIAALDPNINYLLQRYAEASGFQTVRAGQNKELLPLARRLHPDLIVMEIEQPESAGKQVLQQLKKDVYTANIPVVVYSCYDEITVSAAEGAAGCLQKSVMYTDFLAALEQAGIQPEA
jgi:two-component system, cell cycle response regulator DivK